LRPGSKWGLWWTKRHWGRSSPSTSASPANHHSINFSVIIITRGWHNRPIGGRSAEWTQSDSTPPLYRFKKIIFYIVVTYTTGMKKAAFGFCHSSDYEELYLLGCDSVQSVRSLPPFRKNVLQNSVCFSLVAPSAYSSTLKTEAVRS
jgi:hypothetical protein